MLAQSSSNSCLAFGPFELDTKTGELTKSGIRIRLASQPRKILTLLLTHPGDVIRADELRRQVWDDGTFVDFEHGLHAAINKLRQILGDSANKPRFIETLPGRGYRFIAAVEHRLPSPKDPGPSQIDPISATPGKAYKFMRVSAETPPAFRWDFDGACGAGSVGNVVSHTGRDQRARFQARP